MASAGQEGDPKEMGKPDGIMPGSGGKPGSIPSSGGVGGLGGPGIGAGGKVDPVWPMPGVKKTDTLVRGERGKGESLTRAVRGGPDRVDPHASYYDVYPGARRAAEDALSKEPIPSGYKKQVKEYFDAIAPK